MPVNCTLGRNAKIAYPDLVNIYGGDTTIIGEDTSVGPFVEIQKGVTIGKSCKIQSHAFICEGVVIEDGVFIGHGVMFINDRFPRATTKDSIRKTEADWKLEPTLVGRGAALGRIRTILCGIKIGEDAIVGAGSVVTKDVPAGMIVAGNPAKVIRKASC